ncbi:MAG: hypothetical protein OXH81_03615 [Gemmatimonadetes bacterium]|nr:hypothetical protein [Gemmatimonadota bacterium]
METQTNEQFTIEVNGVEIKVKYEKLVAADVLKLAADNGAIRGKPEEFVLESDDPEHEFKNDEWVDFYEYKIFTAERSGPTPVAEAYENE